MTPPATMETNKKMRKACDLCYRKRIKCDGKEPRCSHCEVYDCECTHQAESRRKKPRSGARSTKPPAASGNRSGDKRDVTRPRRLSSLESPREPDSYRTDPILVPRYASPADSTVAASPPRGHMELPSERVVRNLVGLYLSSFNNVLPLYDPAVLLHTVDRWYSSPSQRDATSWATINVAMGLAQFRGVGSASQSPESTTEMCISRAQSVMTEVLMGDFELANIQVVLGLVLLFQGSPDIRPALFFMSAALRLAHAMCIHRSDSYTGLSASEATQRRRVFWIAYILDRDNSLRTRQPPVQQDEDMDVDVPPATADADEVGCVVTTDGQQVFNIFHAYIELAQIEGLVYRYVLSIRASQTDPAEVEDAADKIQTLIQAWMARIPPELSADALCQSRQTTLTTFLCTMYCRIIECRGILSQVNCKDLNWVNKLLSHARSIANGLPSMPPIQPKGWADMIRESRSVMRLFMFIERKDSAFLWMHLCPYLGGLLTLSANSLLNFYDAASLEDDHLIAEAVAFLSSLSESFHNNVLISSMEAQKELNWHYSLIMVGSQLQSS